MNLLDLLIKIGVDDKASDKIGGIASKVTGTLGNAAGLAAKGVAAATAAVTAATAAVTKQSLDAYAAYEQNVGGVQKLFGNMGQSLEDYAASMATSFSAALISSLGGDTEAAAAQAQKAMVAMSDNVNTFGTNMTDVQNAFQGFAKQNYTMLDNLKLGRQCHTIAEYKPRENGETLLAA